MPRPAGGANLADNGEDDVLGGAARRQLTVHPHQHVFGRFLQQGLGGQHVLNFRGADPKRQRAHRAVRGRVGVAAHDRHARQREPLFRADDMDDALAGIRHGNVGHAKIRDIPHQRVHLQPALRLGDAMRPVLGRDVVVGHGDGGIGAANPAAGQTQTFKRLRRSHLMDEMPVNIKHARAIPHAVHHMGIPNLVEQSPCGHGPSPELSKARGRCPLDPR